MVQKRHASAGRVSIVFFVWTRNRSPRLGAGNVQGPLRRRYAEWSISGGERITYGEPSTPRALRRMGWFGTFSTV